MKKILLFSLFCLLGFVFFVLAKNNRKAEVDTSTPCIDNPNLYEKLLKPNLADTLEFAKLAKRYHASELGNDFSYEYIALTRGLVDSSLLDSAHYNKYGFIDDAFKYNFILSPLIIEGKVERVFNADTVDKSGLRFFLTYYVITVTDIIKSNYKIKVGDKVLATTQLYGYAKSAVSNEVAYTSMSDISEYESGKIYLFALHKYSYMHKFTILNSLTSKAKYLDTYCPTTFSLSITSHKISKSYENKEIGKNTIINFLNK